MTSSPLDLRSKNLFKRCVQCDPLTSAQCPACKSDEVCTLIPISCDRCPEYQCQSAAESGAIDVKPTPTTHKSPAPMIAGGVAGGVVLIAITTFLIWRFILKGKRHDPVEEWDPMDYPMEKPGEMNAFSRDARSRASTHTVQSMASTVLTRASNVIQIAFIPGVTTRQQQDNAQTPNTLVPPVPPIPIPTNRESDADLIFMPGDLRDSAFTDVSAFDNSGLRKSLAPSLARTSIASTIYKENAVAVAPIKPSLVSVSKNGSPASSPGLHTPPVPSIDIKKFGGAAAKKPMLVQMPVSRENQGESVGPSPVGSVRGLKPKAVTISKGKTLADSASSSPTLLDGGSSQGSTPDKRPFPRSPLAQSARVQSQDSEADSAHVRAKRGMDESDDSEYDSSPHERSRKSLMRKVSSPFSDSAAVDTKSTTSLNSAKGRGNAESPFDDRNRL